MKNSSSGLLRSNQEQAVAAWINHLNQVRIDGLWAALRGQDENLREAFASIDGALRTIDLEVVATNRGGIKGMHGFIAEVGEVGISNARRQILGDRPIAEWVNDNGPADLVRGDVEIQQKFVMAGGRFGLNAVSDHLQKYPEFIQNGGKYQIPRDHYETVTELYAMSSDRAHKLLSGSNDGPSLRDWRRVQEFFNNGPIGIDSLEPSTLDYSDAQRGAISTTMAGEKEALRATDERRRTEAYRKSRPSAKEGAKATFVAAAVEGGTAFVLAVTKKCKDGKSLRSFTKDDWTEIAGETGMGTARGGIRGLSIYALTNFTATSAAVASAHVTAVFGIAEQANRLRTGEICETEFIENSQLIALETAVSALSSLVGQVLIPVPVLGAVIGNATGMVMYRAVSSGLSEREAALIERHLNEQRALDDRLDAEYREVVAMLEVSLSGYLELLDRAFSPDVEVALLGSVDLALELGVAPEEILDSEEKVSAFFLD
ncbi:MAG: hypothetical protein QM658_03515 [Gordonia sp. (in: high G+C Gram-positive bacteria)]